MRFLGWVPDPGAYIAGATVLAIPSRDESFSQTAIIGLAHGVPVIGTDVDGFPETLGDGRGDDRRRRRIRRRWPWRSSVVLNGSCRAAARNATSRTRYEPARVADVYEATYRHLLAPEPTALPAIA